MLVYFSERSNNNVSLPFRSSSISFLHAVKWDGCPFLVVSAAIQVFYKMLSGNHIDSKQVCRLLEDANSNRSDDSSYHLKKINHIVIDSISVQAPLDF